MVSHRRVVSPIVLDNNIVVIAVIIGLVDNGHHTQLTPSPPAFVPTVRHGDWPSLGGDGVLRRKDDVAVIVVIFAAFFFFFDGN